MWDSNQDNSSFLSPGFGLPKAIPSAQSNIRAPQPQAQDDDRNALRLSVAEREFRESLPARTVFVGFVYVGDPDGEGIFAATENLIRSLRAQCGSLDGVIRFPCRPPVNINRPVYHNPTFLCVFQSPEGAEKAISLFDEQVGPSGNRIYVVPSERYKVSDVVAMANFRTLTARPDAEFPNVEQLAQNARLWSFVLSPVSLLGVDWKAVKMAVDANCAYVIDEWSVTVPLGYTGVEETREDRFRAAERTRKAAVRGAKQRKTKKLRVAKLNKVGSRLAVLPGFQYVQQFFESKRNDVDADGRASANGAELEETLTAGRNPRRHADWSKHLDACRRGSYLTPQVLRLKFPTQQGEALAAPPRPPVWKQVVQAGADRLLRLVGLRLRTEPRFLMDDDNNKHNKKGQALVMPKVPSIAEVPSAVPQIPPGPAYNQQTIDVNVSPPFAKGTPPASFARSSGATASAMHKAKKQSGLLRSDLPAPQRPSSNVQLEPGNSFSRAYGINALGARNEYGNDALTMMGAGASAPLFSNSTAPQQQQQQQQQSEMNASVLSIMKETSGGAGKSHHNTSASTGAGASSLNASRESKIKVINISNTN